MFKKIFAILLCTLMLAGCTKVKLIDGKEAIVTFDEESGITAEELFESLKETHGVDYLVNLIDSYLLDKKYDETTEEKNYVKQIVDSVKEYAANNNTSYEDYIRSYYDVKDDAGFKDYIALNYRRNFYTTEYAKTIVTDKQINEYYDQYTVGDIEASHILISVNVASDATEEEKTTAEENARKTALEVIEKLNNGEDFSKLAKEYSDDNSNSEKGGSLGYFNRGDMVEEFEDAAVLLEVGKYTTTPVKTTYGYHIIYKTNQKDKPTLEDAKNDIIDTVSKELLESNANTIYIEAMENLRKENNMEIADTKLKNEYEDYMLKLKNSTLNTAN